MYKYVYYYSTILEILIWIKIWLSNTRYVRSQMSNFIWLFQAFPGVYDELLGKLLFDKT